MSRAALAFLALAACYRPSEREACTTYCGPNSACPSERTCQNGYCIAPGEDCGDLPPPPDAAVDAMQIDDTIQDVLSTCIVPQMYASANPVIDGSQSYTHYNHTSAYADAAGAVSYRIAGASSMTAVSGYSDPRLAPGGTEMFLSIPAGDAIAYSKYNSVSGWTAPVPVTAGGSVVRFPGTPSATQPRHMVASSNFFLYEGVENLPTDWAFDTIAAFPGTEAAEPSLSRDGLRLVYVARDADMVFKIWVATRANLSLAFSDHRVVYVSGGNEHDPFIDDDCNLFFNIDRSTNWVASP